MSRGHGAAFLFLLTGCPAPATFTGTALWTGELDGGGECSGQTTITGVDDGLGQTNPTDESDESDESGVPVSTDVCPACDFRFALTTTSAIDGDDELCDPPPQWVWSNDDDTTMTALLHRPRIELETKHGLFGDYTEDKYGYNTDEPEAWSIVWSESYTWLDGDGEPSSSWSDRRDDLATQADAKAFGESGSLDFDDATPEAPISDWWVDCTDGPQRDIEAPADGPSVLESEQDQANDLYEVPVLAGNAVFISATALQYDNRNQGVIGLVIARPDGCRIVDESHTHCIDYDPDWCPGYQFVAPTDGTVRIAVYANLGGYGLNVRVAGERTTPTLVTDKAGYETDRFLRVKGTIDLTFE